MPELDTVEGKAESCASACHENIRESGGIAPLIHTSTLIGGEWLASGPGFFTAGKEQPVHTAEKAKWAPESVWMFCRKKNLLMGIESRFTYRPAFSAPTTRTALLFY